MSEIIGAVDTEMYIGTVYSYDVNTREIEAFIPKLMPAIAEGRDKIKYMTNLGSTSLNNVLYNNYITIKSTMTIKAYDKDEAMPEIGSKVAIFFLDADITRPYWTKFNMQGDYEVIESEKYPKRAYLKIGSKQITINNDDLIKIELPDNYKVILIEDGKTKTFKLTPESDIAVRLMSLENKVGQEEYTKYSTGFDGSTVSEVVPASGLVKIISDLQARIRSLENSLANMNTTE